MTRYFTFTNDNSNKFWQLDAHETSFTVTFGKVGTAGQSQMKTFDSAEKCQKETDKLIREKTGKGYVESVPGEPIASPVNAIKTRPVAPPKTDPAKEELDALLTRYDEIIRNTQTDQLLPFLQSVDKRWYEALRKAIKQAKKYWCEYVELSKEERNGNSHSRWDYRGKWEQRQLVSLSGLALLTLQELKGFDGLYNLVADKTPESAGRQILTWAKPRWLTDFLLQQSGQGSWQTIAYHNLRDLEANGLVDYQPELFARSVTTFATHTYSGGKSKIHDHRQYVAFLASDEQVQTRELPTLFDYPTEIHQCTYAVEDPKTKQWVYHPVWPLAFAQLLTDSKLDRLWFLEKCLSVQTKDWNGNLRGFFRKQFEAANPTTDEFLALQSNLFPLLAAGHPHVVNWTINLLKDIHPETGFRVPELLEWASAVMMRDDCKTGLKTLLSMLERLAKKQPEHAPTITHLLADVFAISDLPLQTKAAQLIIKFGNPTDADLQERLQTYAGQMLGNVPGDLRAFLNAQTALLSEEPTTNGPIIYQYAPPKPVQRLVSGQEVSLPATWNDFVFLIGKFIGSDDPLDMEILMNALILPPADMPADFREQLKMYEKKLEKTYFESRIKSYTVAYLIHWLSGSDGPFVVRETSDVQSLRLQCDRLQHVKRKRKNKSIVPLLSLPTHAPCWIAPAVLIDRLLACQRAGEAVDPLDFAIAIARMPRESTTEALAACGQLEPNTAALMQYCLGATPELAVPLQSTISKLMSAFRNATALTEQQGIWAVAARTYGPDAEFPVFANTLFRTLPNVVNQYVPAYTIEERFNEWKDYHTKETMRYTWRELTIPFVAYDKSMVEGKPFHTLLYSNDLLYREKASGYTYLHPIDIAFWHSLIPQQPEPLFAVLAKYAFRTSEAEAGVNQTFRLMLDPGFQIREMSLLVLACGLLAKKREMSALAAEVLIHHFGEQTLDAARLGDRLGWLSSYAPMQRLTDALNLVKDVSPVHNKALLLLLDALFAQLATGTELPRTTKKLLEIYLDLLVKLGEAPPEATSATLVIWQANASLKKLCQDILKRS